MNCAKEQCVARDWKIIPTSHPEGVNELSLAKILADLEDKLGRKEYSLEKSLGGTS